MRTPRNNVESGVITADDLPSPGALAEALAGQDLPAFSSTLNRIVSIDPSDELPVNNLARIIIEDCGLAGKILKVVNGFYYNRTGKAVSTVTQAVMLLGFNNVRDIALGMAVLDLANNDPRNPLKLLLLQAFIAAHLARSLADETDGQPEVLFLRTLFYPIARIYLARNDMPTYLKIERAEAEGDADARRKAARILNVLGKNLYRAWNIPPCVSGDDEGQGGTKGCRIVAASNDIARAMVRGELNGAFDAALSELEQATTAGRDVILDNLKVAAELSRGFAPVFDKILVDMKNSLEWMEKAPDLVEGSTNDDVKASESVEDLFPGLFLDFADALAEDDLTIHQTYSMAIECLYRGLGLEGAGICLFSPGRQVLTMRFGIGEGIDGVPGRIGDRGGEMPEPFRDAFKRNGEVFASNSSVCVCPIRVHGRPIGCFYLMRRSGLDNAANVKRMRMIRYLVERETERRSAA